MLPLSAVKVPITASRSEAITPREGLVCVRQRVHCKGHLGSSGEATPPPPGDLLRGETGPDLDIPTRGKMHPLHDSLRGDR